MTVEMSRRQKAACQNCTKAKAKCSPSENSPEICYRCQRLNKTCVYDEFARKRGPKARSRVKQLEQRVDNLIDLLTANGQVTPSVPASADVPIEISDSVTQNDQIEVLNPSETSTAPLETPESQWDKDETTDSFDPVAVGMVDLERATILLREYKESFTSSFPFVIIPAEMSADDLRHQQPFLFHAIMAIMTYKTPMIQHLIACNFKNQMATRMIVRSDKSLGILQALLVFAAWYHFSYRAHSQHITIIIQLCVALIQDLGLSKNPREKLRNVAPDRGVVFNSQRYAAEQRAFLGTYYLAVAFAQAWRKRCTMTFTKYMAQCSALLGQELREPTDALISPLIRLSELLCRVNDSFSYDDVASADIRGDMIIDLSISNFRGELDRIRQTLPIKVMENFTIQHTLRLLEIWIHECSLHTSLWTPQPSHPNGNLSLSVSRLKNLCSCLHSTKTYLEAILATSQSSLYQFAFPVWSGWFYAIIVACKLVFLQENEKQGQTSLEGVQHALEDLLPEYLASDASHDSTSQPTKGHSSASWNPVMVAKEADVQHLFESFIEKLKFTYPANLRADDLDCSAKEKDRHDRDVLFSFVCLQLSILRGFNKNMNEYAIKAASALADTSHVVPSSQPPEYSAPSNANNNRIVDLGANHAPSAGSASITNTPVTTYQYTRGFSPHPIPFLHSLNFNTVNFDSIALPGPPPSMQQDSYEDWMWDNMMEDFAIPSL
ncbi:hypothetical protein CC78DRAFT_536671 [Lojkania enalia]|uniref:Zn(2)-C6 fungal-type domain-containing protein n=1 Tax=Lojkania enalia TaxID=147567 RepID=A0A9P4MWD4_9PLEO|nr:hypothetical protein CC78DRAFT_536671 [Didymosphaeria enalia]